MQLQNNGDKEFLDAIRQTDHEEEVIKNAQVLCSRFEEATNGDRPTGNEITNLLYDVSKLPGEKMALCKQAIIKAGILKSKELERRLNQLNPPEPKRKMGTDSKREYRAKFEGLVDLVEDEGCVRFLVREINGGPKIIDSIELEGQTFFPPPRDQLPYRLPQWDNVQIAYLTDDAGRLFTHLITYHNKISKLPSENYLVLLAAWDFSTYIQEQLPYSGYLTFFNVAGRGKTRTGVALINVAFCGVHTITVRESTLFRLSHNLGASLFLDVVDLSRKLEKTDSEDILLQRFQKGARVSRVQNPEDGPFKDTIYYDVFGPTVIATNTALDKILDTRCFPISMPHASIPYPDPDPLEGLLLRERLVAWRAKRLFAPLQNPRKVMSGRLGDISLPLRSILMEVKPEAVAAFDELIDQMQESGKSDKSESLEGRVIQTIGVLLPQAFGDKLSLPTISGKLNDDIPEDSKAFVNSYRLGHVLKSLGFKKDRTSTERFIWVDREQLESMAQEYGVATLGEPNAKTS